MIQTFSQSGPGNLGKAARDWAEILILFCLSSYSTFLICFSFSVLFRSDDHSLKSIILFSWCYSEPRGTYESKTWMQFSAVYSEQTASPAGSFYKLFSFIISFIYKCKFYWGHKFNLNAMPINVLIKLRHVCHVWEEKSENDPNVEEPLRYLLKWKPMTWAGGLLLLFLLLLLIVVSITLLKHDSPWVRTQGLTSHHTNTRDKS